MSARTALLGAVLALLPVAPAGVVRAQAGSGAAAASAAPQASPAQDALAALADEGRWDEVLEEAAARLARDPDDILATYWEARAEIERALPLLGGRTFFSQDLGRSMLTRAGEQLARVTEHPDDATRDAREWAAYVRFLLRDDASLAADLEAWFASEQRGYAAHLRGLLARQRNEPEALAWLARACEAQPERVDFLLEWAGELARAGQSDAALAAWNRAREADAARPALLNSLIEILPGAERAAQRLPQLDLLGADSDGGRDGLLAWHRAWTLEQLGRAAEAADAFAAATEGRTPDLERAHAQVLTELGRREEAVEHLRIAAAAGQAAALSDLISLGDARAQEHAWDEALALYDSALAIEPRDERAAVNRALTLGQAGRTLDAWQPLIERHPERADILNDAALHYAGWGRTAEARALLERAVLLPGSTDARQNLADLLLADQPPDGVRALQLLDSVLEADPGREWALYLRQSARRAASR